MPSDSLKLPTYGGQALIEGVLMRGAHFAVAAMRSPQGEIIFKTEKLGGIYTSPIRKIPFLRGLVLLWDALGLGMRFLTASANVQTGEEEKIEGPTLYATIAFALILATSIFFLLPAALGQLTEIFLSSNVWLSNLFEGVFRLVLVIAYIWGIGKIPEIRKVFAYHGAEHKTINNFEKGLEMTVTNVSQQTMVHPRCGTAFLLTLVLLSIIVFAAMGPLSMQMRFVTRVLLIPVLAGIAYEYIRWTASHLNWGWVRGLIWPNLMLQKLTTVEPDQKIIEVAIAAFNQMLSLENSRDEITPPQTAS